MPTKSIYHCNLRPKLGILWGLDARSTFFLWALTQDRALKQQRGVWVVDSWNIQGLAFCFSVSELQVGAKVKQIHPRSAWLHSCVNLITSDPLEELSYCRFLGKMGQISVNLLYEFIFPPLGWWSFFLVPKLGLICLLCSVNNMDFWSLWQGLNPCKPSACTVLPVCRWGGSAKGSGCVLGGLLGFLTASTAFLLAVKEHFFSGWRQAWCPFSHMKQRKRKNPLQKAGRVHI